NAILTVACAGPTRPASGQEKPIMAISARPASVAQRLLPILGWLPAYRREWLLPDVLAGLAVWAVMVPEGMAYSGIVGVPPITGLYTIIPPLIVYALLRTSRLLVVRPDRGRHRGAGDRGFHYAHIHTRDLDRCLLPAPGRAAHGLGGRLHPHAGDAGVHRRPCPRHHPRPGAAPSRHRRHVGQLFHQT